MEGNTDYWNEQRTLKCPRCTQLHDKRKREYEKEQKVTKTYLTNKQYDNESILNLTVFCENEIQIGISLI